MLGYLFLKVKDNPFKNAMAGAEGYFIKFKKPPGS